MMEASVVSPDAGSLTEALDSPSITPVPPASPLSPPSLPSTQPPVRPCRPKPPPPPTPKSSQLPSGPPLPPSNPPSVPPASKPPLPLTSKTSPPPLSSNLPPPSLPPPLAPTPASPSTLLPLQPTLSSDLIPTFTPPPLPPPLSPTITSALSPPPPPDIPSSTQTPDNLSLIDRLVESASVWQPKETSKERITSLLEKETAGAFLVHSTESESVTLSVRLPDEEGTPLVHNLQVKQHKTFIHLDGSSLVFDDIFKLICFYCASRDILAIPLRLPQAITTATNREELEVISAMGADFWTSDENQQGKIQDSALDQNHSRPFLYVTVEETPNKDLNPPSVSKPEVITNQNIPVSLQNGEAPETVSTEVKGQAKATLSTDIKYKRPPPRPPSLSSGSGMGLLFSSPPLPLTSSSVNAAAERKEEGRGGGGEREERKSMSTSPPHPSRPPVPLQSRAAPPLPPAPLRRTSSRKSTDRDVGEGREREKGQNPAKKTEREGGGERGEAKTGSKSGLLSEGVENESSSQQKEEEEVKKDGEKKEEEKQESKEDDKHKPGSQCPPLIKKPSRPVPPPRRKPSASDVPVNPSQAGGGSTNQSAGMRVPPPTSARRPDVSLYSPQGGAVVGTDPDSCSNSSTEEEGEQNQEQESNHSRPAESRSPKVPVKRTPTTVMLDRARYRLSTVLTGLISHDRRLKQRIVELARDPMSYFGNLVKEHRAFTLETMANHTTSTELLQEIRQMVTQLKSYLLQSTELQAMVEPQHQYTHDKLEGIVEAALCKSVLKPLREPIYQSLEKLRTNDSSLKQLTQNQSVVLGSTTTALGITTAVPEASSMEKISIKLNNLHQEYSPQKKIEMLLKACKIIYDSMSVSSPGRAHGADDFLPVMMYVLARSNLSALQLDVEYMMELMDPSLSLGEGSYYLTTTYGALEHIKTFDQQRSATRQLSREVQDSIHRWERRRTLNQERQAQGSVRDFLTVCCPDVGTNSKTLGVLPTTTIQELDEQCAARFEQDSYVLSLYMDGVHRPLAPTELAVSVKNSCQPGSCCFVYHPANQPIRQTIKPPVRSCPSDPPPAPPTQIVSPADMAAVDSAEAEEESLICL
ncbi:ras and Rab interactor 3 isoform X2 [Notolabrus celidotus]|uniref:ras and Rab interactor 3 isoform X2 n=1 Tax=Notolabrus celidotus TaxID=1203425 RepID=UPI001490472E|nr:ras and Rab interactor 3 isoform X2 [Notolabrus celidotus]XP_034531437.1 ras and Rab interactor 3 isoform X2 [Notolabrus celidotus]XP_034531438.1 ras and Rab interactor 3 isoform X2 [Notolabrus celidotus]